MAYKGSKPLTHAASKIKNPGVTTRAAKAAGISTHEQEEKWAHTTGNSPEAKKKRARGNLGLAFSHAHHGG